MQHFFFFCCIQPALKKSVFFPPLLWVSASRRMYSHEHRRALGDKRMKCSLNLLQEKQGWKTYMLMDLQRCFLGLTHCRSHVYVCVFSLFDFFCDRYNQRKLCVTVVISNNGGVNRAASAFNGGFEWFNGAGIEERHKFRLLLAFHG